MNYRITATTTRTKGGQTVSVQVPTFVLDGDALGIVDERHAQSIAGLIIDPWQDYDFLSLSITAVAI